MAFSTKQWKAIGHVLRKEQAKPLLGGYPDLRYMLPDGTIRQRNIMYIVSEYEHDLKAAKQRELA